MSRKYLVIIDTTGKPSAKGFSQGIQNFYIVLANDEQMAKNMVLQTFRARPQLLAQLVPCVKATDISLILNNLTQRENSWSYIPIGGTRLPGQQGVIPLADPSNPQYQRMADKDYVPPRPITYSNQNDTVINPRDAGAIDEKDKKILSTPFPSSTVASNPNPNPIAGLDMSDPNVQAALAALISAANKNNTPAVHKSEPVAENFVPPPVLKQDQLDQETLERIRSNIKPALPIVDDNDIDEPNRNNGDKQVDGWGEPIE